VKFWWWKKLQHLIIRKFYSCFLSLWRFPQAGHPSYGSVGGRWSSGKYVETIYLRAAGSSPAPPAVRVFWRLMWRIEPLDRDLILVCRLFFVSSRVCISVAALVHKVGCTCVTLYCSQIGGATCAGGIVVVSECLS
jgi:hypothetical protein